MPSNDRNIGHGQGNGTWAEMDMESPEVINDLNRWSKFGRPDEPEGDQGQWATTDDLINSIVSATAGTQPPSEQRPQADPEEAYRHSQGDEDASQSEYGMWEQRGPNFASGANDGGFPSPVIAEQGPRRQVEANMEESTGRSVHVEGRHNGDVAKRGGRFTSVIALVLSLAAAFMAVAPVIVRQVDTGRWVLALLGSLPLVATASLPAILLGLRSATKPKGQLGKGRGVAAIVICSVSLVVSSVIVVSGITGLIRDLNDEALTAKEQTDSENMTLVFPGGQLTLNNSAIKTLIRLRLLPDNTLDNGAIPISSSNGKVYTGTQEIDVNLLERLSEGNTPEPSEETLRGVATGIAALQEQGVTVTTDGKSITLKFRDGSSRRVTQEEIANLKEFVDSEVVTKGPAEAAKATKQEVPSEGGAGATATTTPGAVPTAVPGS